MTSAVPLPTVQGQEYAPDAGSMIPGEDIGEGGRPDVLGRGMSWDRAVDLWADWMRSEGIRERTIELRRFQISHLGDEILRRSPWRVKPADLTAWLSQQDWAPETRRSYRYAINSFYTWAITDGHTKRNPIADIKAPKVTTPEPRPTPEHVLRAALAIANDQDRMILMLMAYAGLRRAEVAAFRLDQVHPRTLRVIGKGGKPRSIPLHPALAAELEAERQRREAGAHGTGYRYLAGITEGWLFPGRNGGHMRPNAVGKAVAKALGDNEWTGHTLRHAFATEVYAESGDVLRVSRLLGHSRPETSARYSQIADTALHDIVHAIWKDGPGPASDAEPGPRPRHRRSQP